MAVRSFCSDRRFQAETFGFTLIEVLVALAVLSIGITAVIQLFTGAMRSIMVAGDYTKAVVTAENLIRRVSAEDVIKEGEYTETIDGKYAALVSVQQVEDEKTSDLVYELYTVHVTIRWHTGITEKIYTLDTLVAKKKNLLGKML